ncbi:GIY-YIG nuclease family protein [Aquimarina longa]|uniref:GIY-YIG nuclease family protein n=1 Tax=Aquimarina longa TaxID=1080221 RepID=UPI000AB6069D|nr:GIY-YIG nuclease family protein [Aquimarina longa]
MSNNYKNQYGKNTIKIIHRGKVVSQTSMKVQLGGGDVVDKPVQTNITYTDDDGKGLLHINHQAIVVGETVAQVKRSTTAKVTDRGTILVSQLKSEISSRGEDVFFYDNSLGTFEGSLADAQRLFPNVDFSDLQVADSVDRSNPEFKNLPKVTPDQTVTWQEISKYDAEDNGGAPTTWDDWADSLQTGLDIAGLVPGLGEIADLANGCISLARGNYGDAALSFAAMVPGFGVAATIAKQAKKLSKVVDNKGIYDLIIKNADDLEQAYVGQSKNIFKRLKQHFGKSGKLGQKTEEVIGGVLHKMKGSTKLEREIYEQFIILEKYRKNVIKNSNLWKKLLNKVNPVGGRFNLNTPQGRDKFYKMAEEIADKYDLPKTFTKVFN